MTLAVQLISGWFICQSLLILAAIRRSISVQFRNLYNLHFARVLSRFVVVVLLWDAPLNAWEGLSAGGLCWLPHRPVFRRLVVHGWFELFGDLAEV